MFNSTIYVFKEHWALRNHPNFKFFWYEDMKRDFDSYLIELQEFTGHRFKNEDHRQEVIDRSGFQNMKNRQIEATDSQFKKTFFQKFFRQGQVSDWKNHFKPETNQLIDTWIEKNLEGSDINLPQC